MYSLGSLTVLLLSLVLVYSNTSSDVVREPLSAPPAVAVCSPTPLSLPEKFDFYVDSDKKIKDMPSNGSEEKPFHEIGIALKEIEQHRKPGGTLAGKAEVWMKVATGDDYCETIEIRENGVKLVGERGSGTRPKIISQASRIVSVKGKDILVHGFEITNGAFLPFKGNDRGLTGIEVEPASANITISNNYIHTIGIIYPGEGKYGQAHAINAWCYDSYEKGKLVTSREPIRNVNIVGNKISNLHLGRSEAITINGKVDGFLVSGNELSELDNIGIDIGGYQEDVKKGEPQRWQAQNGRIVENELRAVYASLSPEDSHYNPGQLNNGVVEMMGAIYVDGGTRVTIERNKVYESATGIDFGSERGASIDTIVVRNNLVYRNLSHALKIGNESDRVADGHKIANTYVKNSQVYNNTFVDNDTGAAQKYEGAICFGDTDPAYFVNITVANNLVFTLSDAVYVITNIATGKKKAAFRNNIFFSSRLNEFTYYPKRPPESFEAFAKEHSTNLFLKTNPLKNFFVDIANQQVNKRNFDLLPASPAIDEADKSLFPDCEAGKGCVDFLCRVRIVGALDIGAFEFRK